MKRTFTEIAIIVGVFGAASVVGGYLKIPSPIGSIALDSLPGYFTGGYFGPMLGGVVGAIGHLASALTGGLPLGPTNHLAIAATMFFWCAGFGLIMRRIKGWLGAALAVAFATFANGVLSTYLIVALGGVPAAAAPSVVFFVTIAAFINSTLAAVGVRILSRSSN
jgi:uncharacterized membrane protein